MARSLIVGKKSQEDQLPVNSQNPYWILVTFAYETNDTFDRNRMASPTEHGFRVVSRSDDDRNSRNTIGILFDQEIRQWQITEGKGQHIHSANFSMFNSDGTLELLEWLNAGDWCMFWAFDNRKDYETIRRRLVNNHGCLPWASRKRGREDEGGKTSDKETKVTDWNSGLKFVGRIQAPEHTEFALGDGNFTVGYELQAHAFTELENIIYYDGLIHFKYPDALQFYQDLGVALQDLLVLKEGERKGFVNTNVLIPALVQIFLGKGPGVLSKDKGALGSNPNSRARIQDSPNVQFEVPSRVIAILRGKNSRLQYYSDVLQQYIGDQTYDDPVEDSYQLIMPDAEAVVDDTVLYTKNELQDYFAPEPMDWKNTSVWSVIQHFVNEPINEIYTALKPHPRTGMLLPTLIVRRNPYSSNTYQAQADALKAMPFSDVPRWVIPNGLVRGARFRKSDSARTNYVHVQPTIIPAANAEVNETLVRLQAPPVVNKIDIQRHGLRTFITRVAGLVNPIADRNSKIARQYTEFMADIVMDEHLRYNGTLTAVGIQEAISHGDNLVFNGILFHIEGLAHSGGVNADGQKFFDTSLQLSHGIPLVTLKADVGNTALRSTDPLTKSSGKHEEGEKRSEEERVKDQVDVIEEQLRKYKEPPEDEIRKLRNDRDELALTGLVGARVHSESNK